MDLIEQLSSSKNNKDIDLYKITVDDVIEKSKVLFQAEELNKRTVQKIFKINYFFSNQNP